jgi:hypothetical protein
VDLGPPSPPSWVRGPAGSSAGTVPNAQQSWGMDVMSRLAASFRESRALQSPRRARYRARGSARRCRACLSGSARDHSRKHRDDCAGGGSDVSGLQPPFEAPCQPKASSFTLAPRLATGAEVNIVEGFAASWVAMSGGIVRVRTGPLMRTRSTSMRHECGDRRGAGRLFASAAADQFEGFGYRRVVSLRPEP